MAENREYGIIREQGEYMEPVKLKPEENAAINRANTEGENKNDKK